MDVRAFRSRMIKLGAFMLVIILGFPFILYGLVKLTSCGGGGACGAVAAIGGMILRPLALLIFVIGAGKAIYQRCRHAQLTKGWGMIALLWIMGSSSFLLGAGNFWGANFGMGMLAIRPPVLLLFLTALTIFLAFYQAKETALEEGRDLKVAWALSWLSAGLSFILNFPAIQEPFTKLFLVFNIIPIQNIVAFNKVVHPLIRLAPSLDLALSWIAPATFSFALWYIYSRSGRLLRAETHGLGFQE